MAGTTRGVRLVVLAACLAAGAAAFVRSLPPAPRGADAPASEFSATRAWTALAELLADEAPHPVGTAANAAVRERLLAQVRALGLEPEEHRGFACNERGACAPVVNVVARVPGQTAGPAVALAAHYDSVPAGPGAADDGSGTALVLESLRALKAEAPHRNPLVAIWTDGEEPGLLGARALVETSLFAGGEVGVVVNVEARGTSGPSRMFETNDGNAGVIAAYAAGVARPGAHSLSYEVYKLLPNDTDLTVFKAAGVQGLGSAFVGGVRRYHTPRDDLAHLDPGSLQQQGDAALGAARALLAADLSVRTATNTTYADVFGLVLLRWPAVMNVPLALAGLVLLLAAAAVACRRGQARARGVVAAAAATLGAPAIGAAGAWAAVWAVGQASEPLGSWPAGWWTALAAVMLAASAASVLLLRLVARRVGPVAQGLGVWLIWALLGLALAFTLPGASILPVVPTLVAAGGLALAVARPRALWPALGLAGGLAFALWVPLVCALPEVLGLLAPMVGAATGWLWTAASPVWSPGQGEKDLSGAPGALFVAAAVVGFLATREPRFSADSPAKVNVLHVTDLDSGQVQYMLDAPDGVPGAVAAVVAWRAPAAVVPWSQRAVYSAPAPRGAGDGPTFLAGGEVDGEVRAVVKARPGAVALVLVIPGSELAALTVGGRALDPEGLARGPGDTRVVTIHGPPADGVAIAAKLRGRSPWVIADLLPGLPEGARVPAQARPDTASSWQMGDVTAAVRRVQP